MPDIPGFGGVPLRHVARRTYRQFQEDDLLTYAGSLAFHGILALFPLLVFLLGVVLYLDLPQIMERFLEWANAVMPGESVRRIGEVLSEARQNNGGLLSLGALGAVWAASGGVRSAMNVLNRAYDVAESRTAWKRYLLSLAYTLALVLLILLATGLMLVGPRVAERVAAHVGMGDVVIRLWTWLRYPVAIALLMVTTAVAYSVLPNVPRFRWLTPGAVLAVLLWLALSLAFQLYLDNFGRYNVLYGSLGAIIVLLLYLWMSSIALLLGGEVNAVIERGGRERTGAASSGRPAST